jgi:hypothetical protein
MRKAALPMLLAVLHHRAPPKRPRDMRAIGRELAALYRYNTLNLMASPGGFEPPYSP